MTTAAIPQAKILRVLELMQTLCQNPKTAEDIARVLDMHVRNAYRYLSLIQQLGVTVHVRKKQTAADTRKTKYMYYINQCPCCGAMKGI